MGNILYIRVSASTYNEDDVKKHFPLLHKLAWRDDDRYIPASQRYGVLELIATVQDVLDFAQIDIEVKNFLMADWKTLCEMKKELEQYVLEWKPHKASELTYTIEEKLAEIEKNLQADKYIKTKILKGE